MSEKEAAEKDYLAGMKYKDIADKYGITLNTVKSWKQRYGWNKKGVHTKEKKVCTQKEPAKKKYVTKKETAIIEALSERERLFCEVFDRIHNATQAYVRVYEVSYASANAHAWRLLAKDNVKAYLDLLRDQRKAAYRLAPYDIVEQHMKIAFSDMSDYVEFGRVLVPIMTMYGPLTTKDDNGKDITVMKEVNDVRFKDFSQVDGALISSVKMGRDGASIQLENRSKSLEWLSNYFELNPADKHKVDFDNKKLALEERRVQIEEQKAAVEDPDLNEQDNFLEALDTKAAEVWVE